MQYYFAGLSVGLIVLQTSIIAPSLAKTLSREQFGVSIRAIWPKFFLLLAGSGLATLASLWWNSSTNTAQFALAACTAVFPAICYGIIPATNRATDTGNDALFKKLHVVSVLLTVAVLFGNIGFLFT